MVRASLPPANNFTPPMSAPVVVNAVNAASTVPARASKRIASIPTTVPFTIVISNAEQAPFSFLDLRGDSKQSYRPLIVPVVRRYLVTGDYSIEGFESQVAIERKSLPDLYGSLGGKNLERRERLRREHERMQGMALWGGHVGLVVEASLQEAMESPPPHSGVHPSCVLGVAVSWPSRYSVPWHWAGSRRWAEVLTYKLLERAWRKLTTQSENMED